MTPHVRRFNKVSFIDDATLQVTAWGYDSVNKATDRWQAFRITLSNGSFAEMSKNTVTPLSSPCTGRCDIDIVDESPNKQWQLAFVKGQAPKWGVWLLGRQQQLNLSEPGYWPKWQWADDSSALWFSVGFTDGFGLDPRVVFLQDPVLARKLPPPPTIDDDSKVVFDPKLKVVESISFTLGISLPLASPQTLNTYSVAANDVTLTRSEKVNGLVRVSWDASRRTVLLTTMDEDGLQIATQSGEILARVPRATFEPGNFLLKQLVFAGGTEGLAVSSDRTVVAWVGGQEVKAYRCARE